MKLQISFIISLFAIAIALSVTDEDEIAADYLKKYNIRGRDITELKRKIIKKHFDVEEHNKRFKNGLETSQQEVNEFSFLSMQELASSRLGFNGAPTRQSPKEKKVPKIVLNQRKRAMDIPDYWNWNDHGVVRGVQDQKNCSACYAFASDKTCKTYLNFSNVIKFFNQLKV